MKQMEKEHGLDRRQKIMLKQQIMGKSTKSVKNEDGEVVDRTSCCDLSIKKLFSGNSVDEKGEDLLLKLLAAEKKQKKLEKQLLQAGLKIAEDIPYEEAKSRVTEIAKRMNEIGSSDMTHPDPATQNRLREEYFKLEPSV